MSFTYSAGGAMPLPSLAWQFENSNVDSVTGLTPSAQVSPGPAQLQGSASLVTNAPTSNTAVYFPGTSGNYMNLGATGPTTFNTTTSNTFVEAWVYFNALGGFNSRIYGRYFDPTTNGDYNIRASGSGIGAVGFTNSSTVISHQANLQTGVWTHIAFSLMTNGTANVFVNGVVNSTGGPITVGYTSTHITLIGGGPSSLTNAYIRDLRVVQGGVVPVATFTPGAAPFSYASPGYVANMGTTVFTLLGQFVTYPAGKFGQSISFNNKNATSGGIANCYSAYSISSLGLTSNAVTVSTWIKPYYTFPVAGINQNFLFLTDTQSNYNFGINSGINQSQIFFYTNAGNFTILNGTNLTTQAWNHYTMVFSNVNQTASNTSVAYYFNGTQVGVTSNVVRSGTSTLSGVTLGAFGGGTNATGGGWCELDDLRIFDRSLTSLQVQSIYQAQGMPSRGGQVKSPIQPGYIYEPYNNYTLIGNPNVKVINSSNPDPRIYVDPAESQYSQWTADPNLLTKWDLMPFKYYILLDVVFKVSATDGLRFPVSIPVTGTYNVEILVYGAGGVTDSLWIGVDSETAIQLSIINLTPTWRTGLSSKSLSAGNHTLELYMREPYGIGGIRIIPTGGAAPTLPAFRQNLTGTPLFSQLSSAATSSAVGAFSLRAVNGTTVKAVQIKRQSDNATQDFYADRLGNLLAAPVTGQTLQNWLGSSSGNVVTWYDQSGAGRNATGTQSTIVRTSNVNQQWAVNPTNGGLSLSGGTFLNGTDFTITCTTKRLGTQGNDGVYGYGANTSWVSQASVPTTYGNNTRFALVMPNAGSTDVRFNDSSFSAAFSSNANVVPSSFVAATEPTVYTAVTLTNTTQRMYINGTANGVPISTLTQLTANASTGFTIGTVNFYGSFLGEIGELIIFNNALSTSDISTLYSAR